VCQLCGLDDTITITTLGPGLWRFECSNATRHATGQAWSWNGTATHREDEETTEDKAEELGLFDDLLHCLAVGEPYVE
jgi:hypothetical protein